MPEAVVGKFMADLMPLEIIHERMELVSEKLGEDATVRHEYPIEIDGKTYYREALYVQFNEEEYLAIVRDITGRRAAEAALRENEAKYRTILEDMEEGYYETDLGGTLTFFNESFCKITGVPRHRLKGMNVRQFMDKDNVNKVWRAFNRVYTTGEPDKAIEVETIHSDGGSRYVEVSAYLMRDAQDEPMGFRGVIRDVTLRKRAAQERIRLEAQLHQAQKLESLGTLAGGIAHDFNNLLMGIQGRTSLMEMNKATCDPDMEHLKGIESYVKSAAALTKQLLGLARGGKYEVRPTNINALIQKSATLFGRTKKEITIHSKFGGDIWTVEADQGQIEQVLMNLFINAWQAMPGGGGAIYLETENVTLNDMDVRAFNLAPGRFVRISVTDTGVGMDEDTMARIFDPFFTTKEKERGTGLGLASAYGIIKNHGGKIDVSSKKGEGTTFTLYFPASDATVVQGPVKGETLKAGAETVLLVDDEEMIIDVGAQLLARLGYGVVTSKSGPDALEIYKERQDHIDLVIVDMVMPGMTGGETFDRLKQINPKVKAILSSGYSVEGEATEILNRGCLGFIQKPFNMKTLSRKLREVLDGG
jgi:PAS domain S-box-containing protein